MKSLSHVVRGIFLYKNLTGFEACQVFFRGEDFPKPAL